MIRAIPRAIAAALFGALVGPIFLVVAYATHAGVGFPVTNLPPNVSGFYPAERDGSHYFVWTSGRATVNLPGLDRRSTWSCSVSFRGARGPSLEQPYLQVAVDGVTLASPRATNAYQTVSVTAAARPSSRGLTLTLIASPTFVPGPGDPRTLGVQVDSMGCGPAGSSVMLPPRLASWSSSVAGALFGAALGLTGITAGSAVLGTILIAAAQTVPLSAGSAPYTTYPYLLVRLSAWMALLLVVALKVVERVNRQPLRNTARFVVIFSAGALYLQLAALLNPSKPVVDAVFHAHRLEWVLAGRYYFTQLSTSATPFPYAIGLYVFAAPWTVLTHDYVTLLRVVVSASAAVAGTLLYLVVVRTRGDRIMGAMAVALLMLMPLSYVIVGNANLTHAFGQAAALATIATALIWTPEPRHPGRLAAVALLAALAFTSHISTLLLLVSILIALSFFYGVLGSVTHRGRARYLVLATAAGLVLSVVLYWGHFGDVYKGQISGARAIATAPSSAGGKASGPQPGATDRTDPPALGHTLIPLHVRALDASRQTTENIGWPILILALVGAWRLWVDGGRDRLAFAIAAWISVGVGFTALSVATAVDVRYQQDAWEFIARVEHMASPGVALLAAAGAAWAWRGGWVARLGSVVLLSAALVTGVRAWQLWL